MSFEIFGFSARLLGARSIDGFSSRMPGVAAFGCFGLGFARTRVDRESQPKLTGRAAPFAFDLPVPNGAYSKSGFESSRIEIRSRARLDPLGGFFPGALAASVVAKSRSVTDGEFVPESLRTESESPILQLFKAGFRIRKSGLENSNDFWESLFEFDWASLGRARPMRPQTSSLGTER